MDTKKNNCQNMYNSRKGSDCKTTLKPMKAYNIPNSIGKGTTGSQNPYMSDVRIK